MTILNLTNKQAIEFIKRMKRNNYSIISKRDKKLLEEAKQFVKERRCVNCGKKMYNTIDKRTGKIDEYNWKCDCTPNLRVSIE